MNDYLVEHLSVNDAKITASLFKKNIEKLVLYNALAVSNETTKFNEKNIIKRITEDPGCIAVLKEKGTLIGAIATSFDAYTTWIEWVILEENYRKNGLSKYLLDFIYESSKERGVHKIWCDCIVGNTASSFMLKKNGFKNICILENHWYGLNFILWEKFVTLHM